MQHMAAIPAGLLVGETIAEIRCGSEHTPKCGPYGAYTIKTQSGRTFVVWQGCGEVNWSEVKG